MTPQLRDYQQDLVREVRNSYKLGFKCPLVRADTGAGKTILFSYITRSAAAKKNAVLVAAHRKEIIRQISLSLAKFGVEHQVIAAPKAVRQIMVAQFKAFGRCFVNNQSTTMVGSVQTIVSRMEMIDFAVSKSSGRLMVIQDEGHHCVEDTQWGRVMDYCDKFNALGLIVTATPERLDGRGLGAGFGGYADTIIEAPPMSWLIERGYLSPYKAFSTPKTIDVSKVHTRMGDFIASELEGVVDRPVVTGDAISEWKKHANWLTTVVFCVSVNHSIHVAEEFNAAGVPAAHIDGKIDDSVRDKAIMDFADGKIRVLTNVGLVSEGFDLGSIAQKDVTIDCLIDLAPTQSLVNAMQRWGRALRPAQGKIAILLDHAGNLFRHGLPDMRREWSLEGVTRSRKSKDDSEPDVKIATCKKCFAIHTPSPVCPNCGFEYPVQERKLEQAEGELVELSADQLDAMRRMKRVAQGQAQTVEQLMSQGISRIRATKILEARAIKQELVEEALDLLEDYRQRTGVGSFAAFGVAMGNVRKMKPKELRLLIERVGNVQA